MSTPKDAIEFHNMNPEEVEKFINDLWSRIQQAIPDSDESSQLSQDVEMMGGILFGYCKNFKTAIEAAKWLEDRKRRHN